MSYNIHQGKPPQPQNQHSVHSRGQQQSSGHYPRDDYQRRSGYNPVYIPRPNAMRMQQRAGGQSVNAYNPGQIMQTQQPPFIQPVIPQHGMNLQYHQRTFSPQFQQTMTYTQQPTQQYYAGTPNIQQAPYIPNQSLTQTSAQLPMYTQQAQPRQQQQQPQTYSKPSRPRRVITIVDPATNKDITESIVGESSNISPQQGLSATSSTPPMNTATPPLQLASVDSNQAIQAQFAAEVARLAMAPEEEEKREEIQPPVVVSQQKTILPRQEQQPKILKPTATEPVAPPDASQPAAQPVSLANVDKPAPTTEPPQKITVEQTQSEDFKDKPKQAEEETSNLAESVTKPVTAIQESDSAVEIVHQDTATESVASVVPPAEDQQESLQPTADTDVTDNSQVSKKKNQKQRFQELDKKSAKDDDMFSAYRTEEPQKESASISEETQSATIEEVQETTLTNSENEIQPIIDDHKIATVEDDKSSEDQIVNTTEDRTITESSISSVNDNTVDENCQLIEKPTENQVKETEIIESVTDSSPQGGLNTQHEVSNTEKEELENEEKENTAPKTKTVTENSELNEDTKPVVKDNKIELKYKYREDQWSPINLEGKRQYDREFLMQFKDNCIDRPDGLPKIPEVVLDTANIGSALRLDTKSNKQFDFMPGFMKSPRSMGQPMNYNARNSGKGRAPQYNPKKVINSLSSDKELRKSENAWKPTVGAASTKPDEELQTQDVNRKFTGILNKLTPQNFQKLTNQALELQINTEERLKGVIDLVFEKALSEPNFSVAYAHMCRMLSQIEVPIADKPGQLVQFRKLLLNRCQREFESESQDESLLKEKRKEIEKLPEKEREVEKELFELAVIAAKRRSLGNIKFIGELFKIKMLTEHIMHSCIMQLLKAADDESLECMSKLLSTIGKELDHDKARFRMDQYFTQVDKIVKSRKNNNRIRFMLRDVLELRENNWVPRREDNKPKTIDQIHQEAREEEVMKKVEAVQAQAARKANRGRNDRGGLTQIEDGEWNVVAQRSGGRPQQVDPNKFKVTKPPVDDNVQLGPGGRPGSFGGWGRGASGGAKQSSSSQERPSSPATNRFSALSDDRRLPTGGRSMTSSRDRDRDRSGRGSQTKRGSRERDDRQGRDRDRQAAIDQVRRISASQERIRDRVQVKVVEPPPAQPASEELPDPEMKKKSKSTLEEYMHLKDKKEAIQCVKELESPSKMHLFVHVAIEETLERTDQARKDAGELLNELVNGKLITTASYNKGFEGILEFAEDMAIDIPLIWKYLAQIISPAISGGSMNLQNLVSLLEPIKAIGKSGHLLAEVLKAQVKEVGAALVSEKWAASGLQLQQFLNPGEDVKDFIERRDLGFLQSAPPTSSSGMNLDTMQTELKYLLKDASNEEVFQWIDRHFTKQKTLENDFIRALTTAVCESAIHGEGPASRGDSELLKKRAPLLQKYIDSKDNRELQALFAVQSLNNSLANPPGLLRILFDVLYDEDVICEETFYSWHANTDPRESEGKGVALKSVTSFFTWLREAEPDDDDEPEKQ
ncbi:eukaryotic translation initiation factor 4 gamma 3-like isoform X2 [Anneissia japonica]|uniref:eukaryotic translation initiation factor 4 gamma 3-like isoform X2 n=1 Tax=Anneissia japonica TaxID=1529436 RepID=UPI001425A98B|nr:eukaryotic translation initiation factor 4 gamma 3-like isoform X2 [Anneissia japonica]